MIAEEQDLFVLSENFRQICDEADIRYKAEEMFQKNGNLKEVDDFCKKHVLAKRAQVLLKKSQINKRFSMRTFDTFVAYNQITEKAKKVALEYAKNIEQHLKTGKNLIIVGSTCVGTGKTHLACAVAQEVMGLGVPAQFINVCSMLSEIRENFDVDKFSKIELLIIDDFGKEKSTDWVCEVVYSIINKRYEQMLPTVITTEKFMSNMTEHYGERGKAILSRISEDFSLIELKGEDYRKRRD